MKLNISYPANGSQKLFDIDDERKLRVFMEKRMGNEVPADGLGDEWKGYVGKVSSCLETIFSDKDVADLPHHWW